MPYDPDRLQPDDYLTDVLRSLMSRTYARRVGVLGMLRLLDPIRTALRAHETRLVNQALAEGHTWEQIGDALGMARPNAYRRHKGLAQALREAGGSR